MLDEIDRFVRVVEAGSFTAAAKSLGVPKSTLSRALARLEDAARVRLLSRSTRALALTDEGRRFYEQVVPHVEGLRDALSVLADEEEQPHGRLRITLPSDLGESLASDLLSRFVARYPRIQLEVDISARVVNLVDEGYDAAIRASTRLKDSSLVARRLGQSELHFYASPHYVARRGAPTSLDDLGRFELLVHPSATAELYGETASRIAAATRLSTSDFNFLRGAIRSGAGIGVLPAFLAQPDIVEGRLVRVVPDWSQPAGTVWFVYPSGKHAPKKVLALRDFLVEAFTKATVVPAKPPTRAR
jgi:DNA-binding transcriptional LysR family regulator